MATKKPAKLFTGKDTRKEEMAEAKALKSGAISKKQYVAGESKEGHGKSAPKKADAIKSGKLTPAQYAKGSKMANGGYAKKKGC